MSYPVPVLGFAAFSGTGKTTLLEKLLPLLTERGIRIGMVKHAHHAFDIDKPGKDSYRLRKAGARQMLIASSMRQALMTENVTEKEPRLEELIMRLDPDGIDDVGDALAHRFALRTQFVADAVLRRQIGWTVIPGRHCILFRGLFRVGTRFGPPVPAVIIAHPSHPQSRPVTPAKSGNFGRSAEGCFRRRTQHTRRDVHPRNLH